MEKLDQWYIASEDVKLDSHSRKQFRSFSKNYHITQPLHYSWAFIPNKGRLTFTQKPTQIFKEFYL